MRQARTALISAGEGLRARKRKARRKANGTSAPILIEARASARWSVDFVQDQFACGRPFRVLNVVGDDTRERLAAILTWCAEYKVERHDIARGKPMRRTIVAPSVRAR